MVSQHASVKWTRHELTDLATEMRVATGCAHLEDTTLGSSTLAELDARFEELGRTGFMNHLKALGVEKIGEIYTPITHRSLFSRCSRLWTTMTVLWTGQVAACCYDYNGERSHGHLLEMTVRELWNGPDIRHFRKHNFDHLPCSRCTDPDPQFSIYNLMYRRKAARGQRQGNAP